MMTSYRPAFLSRQCWLGVVWPYTDQLHSWPVADDG